MTVRLVHFENAEARPTPLLLLGQLREIDSQTELVYFGGGDWRLGVIKTHRLDERREKAQDLKAKLDQLPVRQRGRMAKNYWIAYLMAQGFVQVVKYDGDDPHGNVVVDKGLAGEYITSIVEDWRRRNYEYHRDREALFQERLAHSDGTVARQAQEARTRDWLYTDAREQYHRIARDRKLFGPAGMQGGREGALKDHAAQARRIILPNDAAFEEVLAEVAAYQHSDED